MSFDYRPLNLNKQFREILANYIIYSNDNLTIETDLPEIPAIVTTDEFRNRQVIANLLNNSLKFTSSGHIRFGYRVTRRFC